MEIHLWWLETELPAKQWLRENTGADQVPSHVVAAVEKAGGTMTNGSLTDREWEFIVTQSEFVD
ncbi:hypothetical protein [Specibacter sp. NPDC078709]|uniref:hypothetical protein n=1 Tax=unclassified Specibacter TaxID=3081321 RepID=UPI00343EE4D5